MQEGDAPHLQGLDEALAPLHGGLVDGGGARSADPAPARRWAVAQRLHSSVSLAPASGGWRGGDRALERK
jgi:hypothetical protein